VEIVRLLWGLSSLEVVLTKGIEEVVLDRVFD
jgi:hypothetical protein